MTETATEVTVSARGLARHSRLLFAGRPRLLAHSVVGFVAAALAASLVALWPSAPPPRPRRDRFANLRRIGVDEVLYKRGHKYRGGRPRYGVLLWAHPGRGQNTLEKSSDRLGAKRCAELTLVGADVAEWRPSAAGRSPVADPRTSDSA